MQTQRSQRSQRKTLELCLCGVCDLGDLCAEKTPSNLRDVQHDQREVIFLASGIGRMFVHLLRELADDLLGGKISALDELIVPSDGVEVFVFAKRKLDAVAVDEQPLAGLQADFGLAE